jgi:anti-sigma factor RsiW
MNDCPNGELRDLLPDFLHDRLEAADRGMVEAHLAGCADCRAELGLLRELRGTLRRAPAVDVSAIMAAIPAYRAPARRRWTGWHAAAAVTLIAVGGTSVAIANRVGSEPAGQVAPRVTPVESGATTPARPDSYPIVAEVPAGTTRAAMTSTPAASPASRELAVGGAVGDLSDGELSMLLDDIESLDVLPSAEVENGLPMTPVAPTAAAKGAS